MERGDAPVPVLSKGGGRGDGGSALCEGDGGVITRAPRV